jgi:rhodanese-related sulfurtransferase
MKPTEVQASIARGVVLLDMRLPRIFAREHVPGAINLQFNRADLVDRAEMILPKDVPVVVHAEPEPIAVLAARLLRDAGHVVEGHLEGGLAAWKQASLPTASMPVLTVDALRAHRADLDVVDARDRFEFKHAHVPGARSLPWTDAWANADGFAAVKPLAVICGDEVRSSLVASILARSGRDARLVTGGMVDWNERQFPVETGVAA